MKPAAFGADVVDGCDPVQKICCPLCVSGCRENCALVLFQDFQPVVETRAAALRRTISSSGAR